MTEAPDRSRRSAGRWAMIVLGIVAIGALAFAIGRFTAFGASTLPPVPTNDSADAGFARDMQTHHQQAVEMAMLAYRTTDDEGVRQLSYDIATAQAAQKGEMYGWLVSWGLPQHGDLMAWMADDDAHGHGADATDEELFAEMGMATPAEVSALAAADETTVECTFLTLMIRHHEGALDMIDAVLQRGSDERVLQVAGSMRESQSGEIAAMRSAQARLGCAP